MATLNQLISEIAHAAGSPNTLAVRRNIRQAIIHTRNELVRRSYEAHGYIDNATFRGMRYHLLSTFDKIYIIDLHGNSKKKEVCPDGSKDENVFDIMQGVAIIIGIKKKTKSKKRWKLSTNVV